MAAPPKVPPLSLCKVLGESNRIIGLHGRHFLALTGLFVFPLSICSLLLFALLYSLFQSPSNGFLNFGQTPYHYLLLTLLSLFVNLFFSFAAASISHSTYHLSDAETADLVASVKSILNSFWPLFSTTLFVYISEVLIAIPFVLFALLAFKWLHQSSYLNPVLILLTLMLLVVLIYLQGNWILAYVVVVVESKWGYASLRRSADLVKGNKRVALSVLLYFGLSPAGIIFWGYSVIGQTLVGWMIFTSFFLTQVLLLSFVATTVLYVCCRESHEELHAIRDSKEVSLV